MIRAIDSVIERRLLVNYRVAPGRVADLVPEPFRPQVVNGYAVAGVCFLRLGRARPARFPGAAGLTSENVAHRVAVEWDDADGGHVGVWVPRRETSSRIAAAAGSRAFPGAYHLARFQVTESGDAISIQVRSRDGQVSLAAQATPAEAFTSTLFPTLDDAMDFFRRGSLGLSPSAVHGVDGICLQAASWAARPMVLNQMRSSLFDDPALFPGDACQLDSALLMTNIAARWTAAAPPVA
jgi:uncharacterized protein YqjF (DUF2071 family)